MSDSWVAVCIPTMSGREDYLGQLKVSLEHQTHKNFKVYMVKDVKPIGRAKAEVVHKALKDHPQYIAMIDDDDLIDPTYLEKLVARMDQGDIDWCFSWGYLFGERDGYIHGEIEPFEDLMKLNKRPAQMIADAELFLYHSYNPNTAWAEDLELWIVWDYVGCIGDIVKEELYFRRWHQTNLSNLHEQKI